MTDNLRGYAFVSFNKAYDRSMGWRQYAAADKDGCMPSKYEYLEDALNMFDRSLCTDLIEAKATIEAIVKTMGQGIVESLKGKHAWPKHGSIVTKYDTTLDTVLHEEDGLTVTLGDTVPYTEAGYGEVDSADEMRVRLRMLAGMLRPTDMDIITSFVNGEHDTLTAACGGRAGYKSFTKRMKVATRGMVMV